MSYWYTRRNASVGKGSTARAGRGEKRSNGNTQNQLTMTLRQRDMVQVEQIKAEIERRIVRCSDLMLKPGMSDLQGELQTYIEALQGILSFINNELYPHIYKSTKSNNHFIMTLRQGEYKIENDGIWIPKAVLEEWADHYAKTYEECAANHKQARKMLEWLYIGKREVLVDLLKMFEPLEP